MRDRGESRKERGEKAGRRREARATIIVSGRSGTVVGGRSNSENPAQGREIAQ